MQKVKGDRIMIWSSLISPIASIAGAWMEGKVASTKAKAEANVAEAKSRAVVAEKVATGDIDWEQAAIENTASSWKDEFALCVLMGPAIGVYFVPEKVQEGFAILATLPDWYQYLLFIAISSSFGIKGVGQAAKMLRKGK